MNASQSDELRSAIARYLADQGIDEKLARVFSGAVLDHVLTWRLDSCDTPDDCKAIIAISFGYQLNANGTGRPGPVNEALATAVLDHYARKARPVYAQTEIAEVLANQLPAGDLHPINPRISAKTGAVKHLGTEEAVAEVARAVRDPKNLSPWLLIAHRHHAVRCTMIASERGFGSMVIPELPDLYDHNSAQPWRRRHLVYLISDVISRLTAYAMHQLYPAIARSEANRESRPAQPAEVKANASRAARTYHTGAGYSSFEDQQSGDLPLLSSNEDYAAFPCYDPQKSPPAAASSGTAPKTPSLGGVTDRTQEDTSRAAAAILKRFGNRVA